MKRFLIFATGVLAVMVLLVSLTGCTGLFSRNRSTGRVTIALPQKSGNHPARSAAAREEIISSGSSSSSISSEIVSEENAYTIDDVAFYMLTLTPEEGEPLIQTAGNESTEISFLDILTGFYTLTVQAQLGDGTIFAEGKSELFEVIENETAEVAVALKLVGSEEEEEEGEEETVIIGIHPAYTLNSCKMEDEDPAISNLLDGLATSKLTFNISEESPLTVTDRNTVTRTVTALPDFDVTNYEDGDYVPFITADNEIVLIRDYAVGTDFAAAYIDNGNIVTDAGVASGFTSGKYVALSNDFDPKANTWEYVMHFKTGTVRYDDTNNDHLTIKGNETDGDGFYACIWYGKFSLCVGIEGNPWTMTGNYFQGKHDVLSNQDYYVRIKYIGDAYTFEYSTDGGNTYTLDMALVKSSDNSSGYNASGNYTYMLCDISKWNTIVPDRPRFGAHTTGNLPFAGEFYMNDTYIKVADEYYWTGAHGYTSAARMDTAGEKPVLMRMTENGAEVWDAIPLTGATVSVQNGKVFAITQPAVSE